MSLSLNYGGFFLFWASWCSVDWVSGVFGLVLLPHRKEQDVHIFFKKRKNLVKVLDQTQELGSVHSVSCF